MTTPQVLDELERRLAAATPGEWRVSDAHGLNVRSEEGMVADMSPASTAGPWEGRRADAEAIVAAHRLALPMVKEIRLLREALATEDAEIRAHRVGRAFDPGRQLGEP